MTFAASIAFAVGIINCTMSRRFQRHGSQVQGLSQCRRHHLPGFSADTIRSVGLRLGNIRASATLGIEGRIGWNLPNDFGSYYIRPGAKKSATMLPHCTATQTKPSRRPAVRPGVHLFGILEAKTVAWDFSLDGNLFRTSHSVTRRPWVAQAAFGIRCSGNYCRSRLSIGRNAGLPLARIRRAGNEPGLRLRRPERRVLGAGQGAVSVQIRGVFMQRRSTFAIITALALGLAAAAIGPRAWADGNASAEPMELRRIMRELGQDMQMVTDGISVKTGSGSPRPRRRSPSIDNRPLPRRCASSPSPEATPAGSSDSTNKPTRGPRTWNRRRGAVTVKRRSLPSQLCKTAA